MQELVKRLQLRVVNQQRRRRGQMRQPLVPLMRQPLVPPMRQPLARGMLQPLVQEILLPVVEPLH
jgi:hypothetical protein